MTLLQVITACNSSAYELIWRMSANMLQCIPKLCSNIVQVCCVPQSLHRLMAFELSFNGHSCGHRAGLAVNVSRWSATWLAHDFLLVQGKLQLVLNILALAEV